MAWQWWNKFNNKFCGKWICTDFWFGNLFMDIKFESKEKGVEVFYSYKTSTFEHEAIYVEYSDNSLNFFHNERKYRHEYVLTYEEAANKLFLRFSDKGKEVERDFIFSRLSLEEETEYKEIKYIVKPKEETKIDILKEYSEYGNIKSDAKFEYKFDERENIIDIIEKYKLDELVKGKNDIEAAVALMNWLCGLYKHGNFGLPNERTPQILLEYADKHDKSINCRGLSLILVQLIRAYSIKAIHITCLPYEEPYEDCHVVVCVYCESLKKWIMLDPSNNLYLKNKNDEIIGIDELRDIIINDEKLYPNEDWFDNNWRAGINGNKDYPGYMSYRNYMAKNLIRLTRYNVNNYGIDGKSCVILIPEKYMQNEAKNFDESAQKDFITSREYFWQM